jgi:hypothetical protein
MGDLKTWKPGESEQIAWESHQLAEADVYGALGIPERSCSMHACDPATNKPVTMSPTYMDGRAKYLLIGRHRLGALHATVIQGEAWRRGWDSNPRAT